MRPTKEAKRRSRHSSPLKERTAISASTFDVTTTSTGSPSGSRLLERDLISESAAGSLFQDLQISEDRPSSNTTPRTFPHSVKQQCWDKADKVEGRDPERWRRDALGNLVFRKLVGCPGCLCHDYDHIVPYSKATVIRAKGNHMELSQSDLIQ